MCGGRGEERGWAWSGPAYLDLLQVLVAQVLEGIDEVLLHLYIQGVLHLSQALHGLPSIQQGVAWGEDGVAEEAVTGGLGLRSRGTPHGQGPGHQNRERNKGPLSLTRSYGGRW